MTDPFSPIRIRKIGHVGLYCRDLAKMVDFYTRVLGFKVSDVNEKGMTFLRFGSDHHSFVLAQMSPEEQKKGPGATLLQQIAMEVANLDALKRIRKTLLDQGVNVRGKIKHEGGRQEPAEGRVEALRGRRLGAPSLVKPFFDGFRSGRRADKKAGRRNPQLELRGLVDRDEGGRAVFGVEERL